MPKRYYVGLFIFLVLLTVLLSSVVEAQPTTGKKGVGAWSNNCAEIALTGADAIYDWSLNPPHCPGVQSVLQVWNTAPLAGQPINLYADVVMGYNECGQPGQCVATIEQQVTHWHDEVEVRFPQAAGFYKVAPVPASGLGDVIAWYDGFVSRYGRAPEVNALGVHCYGQYEARCEDKIQAFINQALLWRLDGVIVSEWGECNLDRATAVRAWMDANPYVLKHFWFSDILDSSWFMGCNMQLVANGALTEVYGKWFNPSTGDPIGDEPTLTPWPTITAPPMLTATTTPTATATNTPAPRKTRKPIKTPKAQPTRGPY